MPRFNPVPKAPVTPAVPATPAIPATPTTPTVPATPATPASPTPAVAAMPRPPAPPVVQAPTASFNINASTPPAPPAPIAEPAVPPANDGPATFSVSSLTGHDSSYLLRMDTAYRAALKSVPGSHQIFFDILTNDAGETWSDLGCDVTAVGQLFKNRVNMVVSAAQLVPGVDQWDPYSYNGPLKAVLGARIARKLARK